MLGVQLVPNSVQLPNHYLRRQWRLFRSVMVPFGWPSVSWSGPHSGTPAFLLHALAIGGCVAPTGPVLFSPIVKGHFAGRNHPRYLQDLVVTEVKGNGLFVPLIYAVLDQMPRKRQRW